MSNLRLMKVRSLYSQYRSEGMPFDVGYIIFKERMRSDYV